MNSLSKDQIKDRLLKRAAKQWGYSDVELENVFDPIVNLLFDVCAKELEKFPTKSIPAEEGLQNGWSISLHQQHRQKQHRQEPL